MILRWWVSLRRCVMCLRLFTVGTVYGGRPMGIDLWLLCTSRDWYCCSLGLVMGVIGTSPYGECWMLDVGCCVGLWQHADRPWDMWVLAVHRGEDESFI